MSQARNPLPITPSVNTVMLEPQLLMTVLRDLSTSLLQYFGRPVRLVVHGGVVMVLHPQLACRKSTRDVDYIHRSFVTEWKRMGVFDADARLQLCIAATASKFGLGADWMNAAADAALPWAKNSKGEWYDPVWTDATSASNMQINTFFRSPGLILVGVSWGWAVALKLVRYAKSDPHDIASILRLGQRHRRVQWTRHVLEGWLKSVCGAMGYSSYPPGAMDALRDRMQDAIELSEHLC
ncbi:uncharacterized protein LAESUDRAFT_764019 [Laetiporus sulphureus 93-53]|uniref:Uncharacterized protein n=1 Tax=Laetiporus sulphureus 93-53 TaxID=1314785 RepID=A0A165BHY2_9APHY|nr:uncharacterized protein LAESUDRAFT_764019 [Laetiporus sulphureus 93-53]KZT01093.1 hypothetical protein LAESUDRAFT_764019 [Laetiporus sulphureus 93-53]